VMLSASRRPSKLSWPALPRTARTVTRYQNRRRCSRHRRFRLEAGRPPVQRHRQHGPAGRLSSGRDRQGSTRRFWYCHRVIHTDNPGAALGGRIYAGLPLIVATRGTIRSVREARWPRPTTFARKLSLLSNGADTPSMVMK
jgi:hypothetical protein